MMNTRTLNVKFILRGINHPYPTVTEVTDNKNHMRGNVPNSSGWQHMEDAMMMRYVKDNGPKWSNMKTLIPGRTANSCRNRFQRIQKKLNKFGKIIDARGTAYRRRRITKTYNAKIEICDTNSAHSNDEENEVLLVQPFVQLYSMEHETIPYEHLDPYEPLPYEASLGVDSFEPRDFDLYLGPQINIQSETPFKDLMEALEGAVSK